MLYTITFFCMLYLYKFYILCIIASNDNNQCMQFACPYCGPIDWNNKYSYAHSFSYIKKLYFYENLKNSKNLLECMRQVPPLHTIEIQHLLLYPLYTTTTPTPAPTLKTERHMFLIDNIFVMFDGYDFQLLF